MKLLLVSCLIISAMAELPRFRPARFRLQRQEVAPTTTDMPETTTDSAPYPASGWKPSGAPFTLPQENPKDSYGAPAPFPPSGWKPDGQAFTLPQETTPDNSYGPPDNTYGPPSTDATNLQVEKLEGPVDVQKSLGLYYVLLPNGELQRVEFISQSDIQKMKYTQRLQLRERAPLLVFGP